MDQKPIYLFLIAFIVIIIGLVVLQSSASNVESIDILSNSSSTTHLGLNGSTSSLTAEEGITSNTITILNKTWLDFDGIDDKINISDSNTLDLTNNATWSFWVKQKTNISNNDGLISKYAFTNQRSWEIELNNDKKISLRTSMDGTGIDTDTTTSGLCGINITTQNNTWHLITITFNNGSIIYYTDGRQCDTDTTTNYTLYNSTSKVLIGHEIHNAKTLNGSMDDILIFNKTLNANQILRFFNESDYGTGLGRGIPVLSYHQIDTPCDVDTKVCIENFTAQMQWLYNNSYETITYEDYLNWKNGVGILPTKPIILVFDDGRLNLYTNGTPIMDTYGFVGIAGIVTSYASNPGSNYMNWTQIQSLKNRGWQIASHSRDHCDLITECNQTTNWTNQFSDSKRYLDGNLTGQNTTVFIYPFNSNNATSDYYCSLNYTICSGYSAGTTTSQNFLFKKANLTTEDGSPYGVGMRRIIIANSTPIGDFISSIDYHNGRVLDLKLNENTGITTYDQTGLNNGIVSGATWVNDNQNITLLENTDYLLNSTSGLFTLINPDLAYSLLNIAWNNDYRSTQQNIMSGRLIIIFLALSILGFVALLINKIYKDLY